MARGCSHASGSADRGAASVPRSGPIRPRPARDAARSPGRGDFGRALRGSGSWLSLYELSLLEALAVFFCELMDSSFTLYELFK